MKRKLRRKGIKKKYKRLVAAVAGAAVMSSAMLPGLPLAHVQAAANNNTGQTPAAASEQTKNRPENNTTQTDRNRQDIEHNKQESERNRADSSPLAAARAYADRHDLDAARNGFSLQYSTDNNVVVEVRTENGAIYLMRLTKDNDGNWTVQSVRKVTAGDRYRNDDPVDVVRANAATFGFDAANDRFSLLSLAGSTAVVQVVTSGQTFKVDLQRDDGRWEITTIRGIGDMNHPATYVPASMFYYRQESNPVTITAAQNTIYQTDNYAGWTWQEGAYPKDMATGVLFSNEQTDAAAAAIAPAADIVRQYLNNIDFSRQFVLYAYLGSVPSNSYGIAIEKVVQTGNDLTITVRAKSPLSDADRANTKLIDYITVDRTLLNFTAPIHITFVDAAGLTLSNYTVNPR